MLKRKPAMWCGCYTPPECYSEKARQVFVSEEKKEYKLVPPVWKLQFPSKLNTQQNICIHCTYSPNDMYTFFVVIKVWKQPKCSSTKWINLVYFYNEILHISENKQIITIYNMTLKNMLSEISQTAKNAYCMISLIWGSKSDKTNVSH